jgi:hypothetical protein
MGNSSYQVFFLLSSLLIYPIHVLDGALNGEHFSQGKSEDPCLISECIICTCELSMGDQIPCLTPASHLQKQFFRVWKYSIAKRCWKYFYSIDFNSSI